MSRKSAFATPTVRRLCGKNFSQQTRLYQATPSQKHCQSLIGFGSVRLPTTGITESAAEKKPTACGSSVATRKARFASLSTSCELHVAVAALLVASVGVYVWPAA